MSSRQVAAGARTATQAVSQQAQAPGEPLVSLISKYTDYTDAMEVDGSAVASQYKLKEKRKRAQSESADAPAVPNQEGTYFASCRHPQSYGLN